MKNHENSTFYEEKKRYKEVKRRLVNQNGQEINNPFMFKEIEVIKPTTIHKNLMVDNCIGQEITKEENDTSYLNLNSNPFEILNILINFISKTIENLCKNKSINEMDLKNNKTETATRNIENLIKLVHSSTLLLKNTNNVLYSVLNKMDEVCKNAILNNPTLFGIIENILLKFCEVQDLLDFDQEDFTIETLFEMSKMIYIYKNKVNEIIKSEDINLNEDYKKQTFDFYYCETDKENDKNVLKEKMNEEEAYTDWSTWIESFIVEKDNRLEGTGEDKFEGNAQEREDTGEEMSVYTFEGNDEHIMDKQEIKEKDHELNLAKRKALIRKDDKVKIKISLGIEPNSNLIDPLESPFSFLDSSPLHTTSTQPFLSTIQDDKKPSRFKTKEMAKILQLRKKNFDQLHRRGLAIKKIGEATFSEVFQASNYVYKIIPLGDKEDQTPYNVFIRETFIHNCLSKNLGICLLFEAFLVQGKYPKKFLDAWDEFGHEENPRPSKYKKNQLFGVIKMMKGPVPLEKVDFKKFNLFRFIRLLSLILYDLEEKYEFEHRDLHWGNIFVGTRSIKIIDFTLSRLKCGLDKSENDRLVNESWCNYPLNRKIVYNDLSKYEWLFEGDASVDEQFEIYRKMRDACKGDWASFNPSSNFYWVDYLARKIKTEIEKYRSLKDEENLIMNILKETKTLEALNIKIKELRLKEDKMRCEMFKF